MKRKDKDSEKQERRMTNESHSDNNPLKNVTIVKPPIRQTIYSNEPFSEKRKDNE